MIRPLRWAYGMLALLAVAFACSGCGPGKGDDPPPAAAASPELHEAMVKMGKGPESLRPRIEQELDASPPPWDDLQPQAKEYARLAASLGQYTPKRGSKDSWAAKTQAFADHAARLDAAAQAKDHDAAKAALTGVNSSCQACHQEHR